MPKFTRDKTRRLDPGGEERRTYAEGRKKRYQNPNFVPNEGRPK